MSAILKQAPVNGTFDAWPRCPEATAFFEGLFAKACADSPELKTLSERFHETAGVQIQRLLDHWTLPDSLATREQLNRIGMSEGKTFDSEERVWFHPAARFPRVRFEEGLTSPRMCLAVESLSDFSEANSLQLPGQHGDADSGYEEVRFRLQKGELAAIVRQGYSGFTPGSLSAAELQALKGIRDELRHRNREGDDEAVLAETQRLVLSLCEMIGKDRATDEFFAAEREYYMARNLASRVQFERQQEIGIGWANHDHHTYRCSRKLFRPLINLWLEMGFILRERFYAGVEAGWGAQVLEHPVSKVVLFCDVDMAPHELNIDFSSVQLPPQVSLGTIGIWCALHGDSIGKAGLHHLEAEFDYEKTRSLFEASGTKVMPAFTDLPMLKQAFTEGEIWKVNPARVDALLAEGVISEEQARKFLSFGATGSHLEILQRWEGFKGFNKTGISDIILQTDARK